MKITVEFNSFDEMYGFCEDTILKREQAKGIKQTPDNTPEKAADPLPFNPDPAPAPAPGPASVTLQDVTTKAVQLIDAGRQGDLQALLAKYGVPALPSLPAEKLGEFMKDLEALG